MTMVNKVNSDGVTYKRLVMDDSYQTVEEWLADKNENAHVMLLQAALEKAAESASWIDSLDDWEVIEHRHKSFLDAPRCTLRRKKWPFDTHDVDVSRWWDTSFFTYQKNVPLVSVNSHSVRDDEVHDINYVSGKAKSTSRLESITSEISLSSVSSDTKMMRTDIQDTFTHKLSEQSIHGRRQSKQ